MYIHWQEFPNWQKIISNLFRKKHNQPIILSTQNGKSRSTGFFLCFGFLIYERHHFISFCFSHHYRLLCISLYHRIYFSFLFLFLHRYFLIQCRNAGSKNASAKIHASTFDRQIPIYPINGASTTPAMVLAAISSTPAVMAKPEYPIP